MILTIENQDLESDIPYSDDIYSMCEHYVELLDIGEYECMLNIVLHDTNLLDGLWGFCDWEPIDKLAEVHIAMKGPAWGITLAHEMVHVKQYFRKELDGSNCRFKWKGRNADGYKYENQPWEREAFRREADLYQKCWPL